MSDVPPGREFRKLFPVCWCRFLPVRVHLSVVILARAEGGSSRWPS